MKVWMVRAKGGEWATPFIKHGYVGFGYGLEGVDMSGYRTLEEVKEKYSEYNPGKRPRSVSNIASQITNFLVKINAGHYVLTKDEQKRSIMESSSENRITSRMSGLVPIAEPYLGRERSLKKTGFKSRRIKPFPNYVKNKRMRCFAQLDGWI